MIRKRKMKKRWKLASGKQSQNRWTNQHDQQEQGTPLRIDNQKDVQKCRYETRPDRAIGHGSTHKLCSLLAVTALNGCAEKHWDCQVSHLASSSTARWNL